MSDVKPVIPALGRFYPQAAEWGYLLLRVVAGLLLIPHIWLKVAAGPAAIAANVMARRGVEPALAAAYAAIAVETIGAICVTLGLFTRVAALMMVVEFIVITKLLSVAGWTVNGGGEFPFLWLTVFVFILLRGGGPYSLDAKLGREV
jgi:putative oxidoreductase